MRIHIYFVYILRCSDGSYYTGITTDLKRRVAEHNSGKGARYTKGRLPVRLIYSHICIGRAEALREEASIKKMSKDQKYSMITGGLRLLKPPKEEGNG